MTSALESRPGVRPSQVLVLYNADWDERHPLLGGDQDSRAVAEHFVRMHTDPVSGEKPYTLGLTGKRFLTSLLAGDHLEEQSSDNGCGVVYELPGSGKSVSACEMRDSRLVEVVLPKADIPWDMHSLRLELEPDPPSEQDKILLVENGVSLFPGKVGVQHQGEWQIRATGRMFTPGPFTARARCSDAQGKMHEWSARYHDIEYASFSATGPDGVRDDQNYLDCVENPVKAFLEDPANALSDGTLLRDHILYFVVCYGLPHTVAAPLGIATGINDQLRDFGSHIDFGQRLQIMYYNLEQLHSHQVQPLRLDQRAEAGQEAFRHYLFRNPLSRPLLGEGINPFAHPQAYQKGKGVLDTRRFTPAQRALRPDRHLFFAMRIDGDGPLEAMELVDRAAYASRYAGPGMGVLPGVPLAQGQERTGRIEPRSPARRLWDLGYRHLFQHERGWVRLEFLKLAPGTGFLNTNSTFLPGGIATFVQSSQGWNMKDSRFHEYLRQGVTVTAGSARVKPRVTPHIHSQSFWDEEVFYTCLLRGFPMGEVLLANQIHLNWITSFVGDPLYRLPMETQHPPALAGLAWDKNVRVTPGRDPAKGKGWLVIVDLETSASDPRVAQMRLGPVYGDAQTVTEFGFERFSSRPFVFVPREAVHDTDLWRVELMDPFGQVVRLEGQLR
ncbi:MAG: hypothetical protein GXY42_06940 [Desulfovibrionales bacterium]|nr:hypothetical protein [Desulfovibrionales bacterium]